MAKEEITPSEWQIMEREEILEKFRDRGTKFRDKEGGRYD
jgi:hypothetical protein